MQRKEKDLILFNDIILAQEFSDHAVASYCALKCAVTDYLDVHCITINQLCFYITGKLNYSQTLLSYLKEGLEELIEKKVIDLKSCQSNYYILDCHNIILLNTDRYFTMINSLDIQKIFKVKNIKHCSLLRYFISVIASINWKTEIILDNGQRKNHFIGEMPVQFFAKELKISETTIISYNKILEEIKLLYIYRYNYFFTDKNSDTVYKPTNAYGKYKDKEYIIKYGEAVQAINNNIDPSIPNIPITESNKKRKLTQRYNQLCKGADSKYSESDILEIYYFIQDNNEKYQALYEKNPLETYKNKIKDTSVFDKYSFIQEYAF